MVIMLLFPERGLAVAVGGCCEAYQAMRLINRESKLSGTGIWTMDDGFFLAMEGLTHNGQPVNANEIVKLIRDKRIPPQPSREKEIRDKSKSDALGKFLTCLQALWLAIQCLARAIQHLPILTLELGTIGYVVIAVGINGFYWYKPKDVLTPLEVLSWEARGMSPDGEESDAVYALARGVADNEEEEAFFSGNKSPTRWEAWLDKLTGDSDKLEQVTVISVCALYGGWHCLAWNFAFPSVAEQLLWRIGSILTSLPLFMLFVMIVIRTFVEKHVDGLGCVSELVIWAFAFIVVATYIISRGFILVEMFIGLLRLPAGVFDTVRWIAFIPHV